MLKLKISNALAADTYVENFCFLRSKIVRQEGGIWG